ncbi:hypothetical protein [Mesorhizobium sp.]|uniref:hypothetical protein n=1 Tax=Mesorhizobium sp. TaxID=1871066 RepID=UPI00120C0345|nr:hypothetical protein [Mesorhizobium sp.]TIO35785.1 MAG: hypothetical protein E5X89_06855 [Mesorhizobium sp.]TIP10749.1 MAG: hypothetical protein E5X73_20170 [Mesorhizobium sp.]
MPKKQASILQHTHAKRRRLWSNPFFDPIGPAESSKCSAQPAKNHWETANQSRFLLQAQKTTNDVESGSTRLFLRQSRTAPKIGSYFAALTFASESAMRRFEKYKSALVHPGERTSLWKEPR